MKHTELKKFPMPKITEILKQLEELQDKFIQSLKVGDRAAISIIKDFGFNDQEQNYYYGDTLKEITEKDFIFSTITIPKTGDMIKNELLVEIKPPYKYMLNNWNDFKLDPDNNLVLEAGIIKAANNEL